MSALQFILPPKGVGLACIPQAAHVPAHLLLLCSSFFQCASFSWPKAWSGFGGLTGLLGCTRIYVVHSAILRLWGQHKSIAPAWKCCKCTTLQSQRGWHMNVHWPMEARSDFCAMWMDKFTLVEATKSEIWRGQDKGILGTFHGCMRSHNVQVSERARPGSGSQVLAFRSDSNLPPREA